jgi:GxxExxY protein
MDDPELNVFIDDEDEPDEVLNRITNSIIGAAIAVHRALGPAYSEEIYEKAIAMEFDARNIKYLRQHVFEVIYRGRIIGTGRVDFLVEEHVVVELKAIDQFAPVHTAQVISYLQATGRRLGILLNFRTKLLKDGIKRVAH